MSAEEVENLFTKKEEILDTYESFKYTDDGCDELHYYRDNVLMAMEEYASLKQSEWISVEDEYIKKATDYALGFLIGKHSLDKLSETERQHVFDKFKKAFPLPQPPNNKH